MPDSISNIINHPTESGTSVESTIVPVAQTEITEAASEIAVSNNSVSSNPTPIKTPKPVNVVATIPDSLLLQADSISRDTVTMMLEIPPRPVIGKEGIVRRESISGSSWLLFALVILFTIICVRYRKNFEYMKSLIKDLTEVRQRSNMFDDTIRETSFLFLLNILYIVSIGIMLHGGLLMFNPQFQIIPSAISAGIVIGGVAVYVLWQIGAYHLVGNIFTNASQTSLWVKGSSASQAIAGVILFPFAMISIFYPEWGKILLIIGGIVFFLAKLMFISKGFRIFFTQSSSWLIFLYYLCTLEIIPVIFTIVGISKICELFI